MRIGVMGKCKKVPKLDCESQFCTSKFFRILLMFFFEFKYKSTFFVIAIFDNINFWITLFPKVMPKFWHLPITPIFNSMISQDYSCFLAKNISYFASLSWKLHNQYCHNAASAHSSLNDKYNPCRGTLKGFGVLCQGMFNIPTYTFLKDYYRSGLSRKVSSDDYKYYSWINKLFNNNNYNFWHKF